MSQFQPPKQPSFRKRQSQEDLAGQQAIYGEQYHSAIEIAEKQQEGRAKAALYRASY
jgi:hypothetical protein